MAQRGKPTLEDDLESLRAGSLVRPVKEFNELELGWPLTIALCVFIAVNVLGMVVLFKAGNIPLPIAAAFRIAGAIAMLRCQRWGFYLLAVFAVFPTVLTLIARLFHPLEIVFGIIPALAIIVVTLTLRKWDRLE